MNIRFLLPFCGLFSVSLHIVSIERVDNNKKTNFNH